MVEKNVFVKPGTKGNLGFYDKEKDRISLYLCKTKSCNEDPQGIGGLEAYKCRRLLPIHIAYLWKRVVSK